MAKSADQSVSPPAGLGSVAGLGEAFKIDMNTGQGVYSYRITLPAGVADHTPKLTLEYSHGARTDAFGLGWSLGLRTIDRRLDQGTPGEGPHETFLDGSSEIVRLHDGSYAPLKETAFNRYTRVAGGWRIEERDGTDHVLGTGPEARIEDPDHPGRVVRWLIERSLDASGNEITYAWTIEDGFACVSEIRWAVYALRFAYEERPDARLDGRSGFLRRLTRRCARMDLFLDPGPAERRLRAWSLSYDNGAPNRASLLAAIGMTSFGTAALGSEDVVRKPVQFGYTRADLGAYDVHYFDDAGAPPPPLTDPDTSLVTLDRAPLPGVLQVVSGEQHYWRNNGRGGWEDPRRLDDAPFAGSLSGAGLALIDSNGSGRPDLMVMNPDSVQGYYENDGQDGWGDFLAYPRGNRAIPEWSSARLRLSDCDGDGRIDALMSTNRAFVVWRNGSTDGWAEPELVPKTGGLLGPDLDLTDPLVVCADVTGDGLQDLVRIRSGGVEYWPNLGNGRYGPRRLMEHSPRLAGLDDDPRQVLMLDVDGDGCADLVHIEGGVLTVWVNQHGAGFADPVVFDPIPIPVPGTVRVASASGRVSAGLVWNSYRGRSVRYVRMQFCPSGEPSHLSLVDNGSGLRSEIFYRAAVEDYLQDRQDGRLWDTNFPFPLTVVARTREQDLVSGAVSEIRYRYHDGHYEPRTRQFQGFRSAERVETGDASRADTQTSFVHLMAMERRPGAGREQSALNGMLARTSVTSLDGSSSEPLPYRVEESEYTLATLPEAADGRARSLVLVSVHRLEDRERTADVRGEEKRYTYDGFGGVVREENRGYGRQDGVPQPELVRTTEVAYAASTTRWLLGKQARVVVRDGTGAILSETWSCYDGADYEGLPLGEADRGLLTRESRLALSEVDFAAHYAGMDGAALGYRLETDADGNPARFIDSKRSAYDARGLCTGDLGPTGAESRYEFDPDGLFRIKLIDSLGESLFVYDRATGQPTTVTHADGSVVLFAYDAQGRVTQSLTPVDDPGRPPRTFSYDDTVVPNSRVARMWPGGAAGPACEAVTYFNGQGEEFQQRVQMDAGTYVVSGYRRLNPWGDTAEEYEPTFSSQRAFELPLLSGRPHRTIEYDGQGRPTRSVNFNGGMSTVTYAPFAITTADANDNDASPENVARGQYDTPHREEMDAFRRRTAVVEVLGGGNTATTTYGLDGNGRVTEIRDALGVLCSYRYDLAGNRYDIVHRAAGHRRLWFDGRGKVVRSLDANGNDLAVELDVRGRIVRLSSQGSTIEDYVYDDPTHNASGKLARVTYRNGAQSLWYDGAGRMTRREVSFTGSDTTHDITYEYDALGRETAAAHAGGTRIEKTLTFNGWVSSLPGVLSEVAYDPRGLPTRVAYVNGVVTEMGYTAGPGRVATQRTTGPQGQLYEDLSYDYDALSQLLARHDTAPGGRGSATYTFDPLYQLTSCTSEEPDGQAVTQAYEYFNHLNLARLDEARSTFHYDDPEHPDRIQGLEVDGAARVDLSYDANGNLLGLPGAAFAYNEKNELERFTSAEGVVAEYGYDPNGFRVSKTVDDGHGLSTQTFFVGREVEIRNGSPACFVRLGHRRVAIVQPGKVDFVHSDYAGSTSFFTDAAGTRIALIAYRPFGNLADTSGSVDFRTFSIHPFDAESGLYYMRRRYYAPGIGRFLTPDPLALHQPDKRFGNPKGFHPYAYLGNDPLDNIDYDGLSFWSVLGAIVGVILAAFVTVFTFGMAAVVGVFWGLVAGALLTAGLVTVGYLGANYNRGSGLGDFWRGMLIGLNAGLNAVLGTLIFGPVIGVALGVINFLAAFDSIAGNKVFQGILGWSSWLMPMSWLVNAIGLVAFVFNIVAGMIAGRRDSAAHIDNISFDWQTGSFVMEGGLIRAPSATTSAFDLGNFVLLKSGSSAQLHETGHTLNLGAYGSFFHLVGAIDEMVSGGGGDALSERLADSHDPSRDHPFPNLDQWE